MNRKNLLVIFLLLFLIQIELIAQNFNSIPKKNINIKKTKIELKTAEQFFNHFSNYNYFIGYIFEAKREKSSDGETAFFIPEKSKYIVRSGINYINQFDSNLFLKFHVDIDKIFFQIDSVIATGNDPNYEDKILIVDPLLRQSLLEKFIYFEFHPIDVQINYYKIYENNTESFPIVYLSRGDVPFRFFNKEDNQVASIYQFVIPRFKVKAFQFTRDSTIFEQDFFLPDFTFVIPSK